MSAKGGLGRGLGGAKLGAGLGGGAGRGIGALIPGAPPRAAAVEVPRSLLSPDPEQPRKRFDEGALQELASSIRAHGLIQPIIVRAVEGGRYVIIAGERRWRAAGLAGLDQVPIVSRDVSSEEAFELAILENINRQDLTPLEEARSYQRLMDERGYTQEVLAERTGKSRAAISNAVRLLKLSEREREAIEEGRLSAGHARALLALPEGEARSALCAEIEAEGLSVREAERRVKRVKDQEAQERSAASREAATPPADQAQEDIKEEAGQPNASREAEALAITQATERSDEGAASREATPSLSQLSFEGLSDEGRGAQLKALEESLREELKRHVNLKSKPQGGGQLTLSFRDDEDLIRLAEFLLRRW